MTKTAKGYVLPKTNSATPASVIPIAPVQQSAFVVLKISHWVLRFITEEIVVTTEANQTGRRNSSSPAQQDEDRRRIRDEEADEAK
jgi:hypothetical protein